MSNPDDAPDSTGEGSNDSGTAGIPAKIAGRLEERWRRAYTIQTDEELRAFYESWADTYEEDHEAVGCFHHAVNSRLLARHLTDRGARVLDVGAGTGLAGIELRRLGFDNLAAVDFSEAMLEVAGRRNLYEQYWVLNLNRPVPEIGSDSFDAAIAVGVFSYGQVENGCLDEMLRVVKPGGCVTFTQRLDFHECNAMGFRDKQTQLEDAGLWELLEVTEPAPYLPEKEPDALFSAWIYRVAENPGYCGDG